MKIKYSLCHKTVRTVLSALAFIIFFSACSESDTGEYITWVDKSGYTVLTYRFNNPQEYDRDFMLISAYKLGYNDNYYMLNAVDLDKARGIAQRWPGIKRSSGVNKYDAPELYANIQSLSLFDPSSEIKEQFAIVEARYAEASRSNGRSICIRVRGRQYDIQTVTSSDGERIDKDKYTTWFSQAELIEFIDCDF